MRPHPRAPGVALVLAVTMLVSRPLAAQDPPHPRVIVVSDYAAILWVNPPPDSWVPVAAELGAVVRVAERWAVGWTVGGDITREDAVVSTGPRARRWITPRVTLGFGAALSVAGRAPFDLAIFTANVRYADVIGAVARFDVERAGIGWGAGLQLGTVPGFGATALSALALGAYALFWSGFEGDF